MAGIGYVFFKCYCSPQNVWKTTPRRLTYVTLFANPHVFVTSSAVLNRKTSPSGLPDVCAHLYHICTTSVPRCMTSVSRLHDVCTTSRCGGVLKTSLERVHGRYWISVFQVLLQSPERLENHTKTSYLCNTFGESTRLRDVFTWS